MPDPLPDYSMGLEQLLSLFAPPTRRLPNPVPWQQNPVAKFLSATAPEADLLGMAMSPSAGTFNNLVNMARTANRMRMQPAPEESEGESLPYVDPTTLSPGQNPNAQYIFTLDSHDWIGPFDSADAAHSWARQRGFSSYQLDSRPPPANSQIRKPW
jgi:hypothetical protein